MVRSISHPLFWLAFAVVTAGLSLIAAPRRVSGQEFRSSTRAYDTPAAVPVDVTYEEPAPPAFSQPPVLPPSGIVGTAEAPHYWIVSSRCAVQHRRHIPLDDGELDVYQRTPDGQLSQANIATLQSQIIPGIPVLMCIHGTFVSWEDECVESHQAYQWIRNACPHLPLQVLFFTWPSDGPITGLLPADVAIRSRQSEFNGFHAARVLNGIPASCPVSFIGHSFGCRVILSTLHLAGGGAVQGMTYPGPMTSHRYRVVFAAAAVDHHWLNPGERYDCALPRTECLVNLQNRQDLPLMFYPLSRPFAGRALARSGLTRRDTRKLGSASEKVINLDVTDLQGHNHLWPGYFQCPEIAAAIAPVIYYPGVVQYQATPTSELPPAPPDEPAEQQFVPPPAPLTQTEYVPSDEDAPLYHPPADDFSRRGLPAIDEDAVPAPPRLVPEVPSLFRSSSDTFPTCPRIANSCTAIRVHSVRHRSTSEP